MASTSPMWKQLFDAVDQRLSPAIDQVANSEEAAALAALGQRGRGELERRVEQLSRRTLHLLNLPAGSDVNRLLDHIARLEREVRDLRNTLTDRENAEYLASLAARHEADRSSTARPATKQPATKRRAIARPKGGARGDRADTGRTARADSA